MASIHETIESNLKRLEQWEKSEDFPEMELPELTDHAWTPVRLRRLASGLHRVHRRTGDKTIQEDIVGLMQEVPTEPLGMYKVLADDLLGVPIEKVAVPSLDLPKYSYSDQVHDFLLSFPHTWYYQSHGWNGLEIQAVRKLLQTAYEHLPRYGVTLDDRKYREAPLLDAWMGRALSGEEAQKYPLAHRIYLHRHVPMLAYGMALPDKLKVLCRNKNASFSMLLTYLEKLEDVVAL